MAAALLASPGIAAHDVAQPPTDVPVKAAFLYNVACRAALSGPPTSGQTTSLFAFVDDPAQDVLSGALSSISAAVPIETVRGQEVGGHQLDVLRPRDRSTWRICHLLFIADAEARRSGDGLDEIKSMPVLTVSDRKGFSQADGLIELDVEDGRMRFAINVDAVSRSGLRLSSRLLGLATITRERHVQ